MNDTFVTVVGNVVSDPTHAVTASGTHVTNLRIASTSRRFDRGSGEWRDGGTLFVKVTCWRALADNVAESVCKGEPVVVTGRLRIRTYTGRDEQRHLSVEIEATAMGHDLSRGCARFQRAQRVVAGRSDAGEEPSVPWTAPDVPQDDEREVGESRDDDAGSTSVPEVFAESVAA